jgi:hypothetical protein
LWTVLGAAPAAAVIGGSAISIRAAPWSVVIRDNRGATEFLCTGSILDPTHVLTAAHCLYNDGGVLATPPEISVEAGVSDDVTPLPGDQAQNASVSGFAVDPGYRWSGESSDDDVAVLTLASPLDLSGPDASAVTLSAPAAPFPGGRHAAVAGFGREQPAQLPSGELESMNAVVDAQGRCGQGADDGLLPDDAIALCAGAPGVTTCNGDSGAGLVTIGPQPTLIAVVSSGSVDCTPGSNTFFTYVGAPAIRSFILGDAHPPIPPIESRATYINLGWSPPLVVGTTLQCSSGDWGRPVSVRYAFVTATGRLLASSANPDYTLGASARDQSLACMVTVSNAGGTALEETAFTTAVAAPPPLTIARLPPLRTGRGETLVVRVALHAPRGLSGRFGACATPPAAIGRRSCSSLAHQHGGAGWFTFVLSVWIRPIAPLGTVRLPVEAVAGVARAQTHVSVRIAG